MAENRRISRLRAIKIPIWEKIIASDAKIHGEFSIGGYKRVE